MKTKKKNHIIFSIILLILFSILFLQGGGFQAAGKERRIALIIGNAHYKSSPLRNPVNDATDMARVLRERGFEVIMRTDANHKDMEEAIREFGKKLQKEVVGLFYFSGHGMQVKGVNYLIPVNEDIQEEDEIKFKAVDANFVLSKMDSAGNQMNVMILDACRDNPFKRSFRSSVRGLVQMDAPRGSLIVYATSPGKTAADGEGRNGIFTKHLLKAIRETDLEVGQLLREVRRGVMNETDGNQIPWESSSLIGDFYFSTLRPEPPKTSSVDISSIKKATKERERIKSKLDNSPDILEKMIEASGGRELLASIRDTTMRGKISSAGMSMSESLTIYRKEPNMMRMDMEIMGMVMTTAYDGETAWWTNPQTGATEMMTADQADDLIRQAYGNDIFLNPDKHGVTYTLKESENIKGKDYFVLVQTFSDGYAQTMYVDSKTYLPYKTVATNMNQMGVEVESETFSSHWRKVDGMMVSFTMRVLVDGEGAITMSFSEVKYNTGIEDSFFKMK